MLDLKMTLLNVKQCLLCIKVYLLEKSSYYTEYFNETNNKSTTRTGILFKNYKLLMTRIPNKAFRFAFFDA